MPRTRSRPKTEEKFQNAVLKLVAKEGCSALGINAVSQLAGADKVLIYRYFGDFNGLLQQVAESRQWLPNNQEVLQSLGENWSDPLSLLRRIATFLSQHIRNDASTHQLVRWRRSSACPLCRQFTEEWRELWRHLPAALSSKCNSQQRQAWKHACTLLALTIEAELCDETIDNQCLEHIAKDLQSLQDTNAQLRYTASEESLPTNLL
ncbi:TetR/AcrR family transcriptional regulator [Coraliomargarita sp. SDUM461004]|uniref:TetR/AcrR family transcriptional regulator n=1 Tax=Thalassobacterium sedimentorum TaxID=3041258 RepID=A0ABU1AJP2_9BACT|nr:TetR/AcrR family transcriptional regulator [Coraliomargarita sp. SDUM461004]MDQ8195032.1 TetR/AcrR family transcriptional regulator [Coraliomargarita sp. SDUM461004]